MAFGSTRVLVLVVLLTTIAASSPLHVSSSGVDLRGCGSASQPCRSINYTLWVSYWEGYPVARLILEGGTFGGAGNVGITSVGGRPLEITGSKLPESPSVIDCQFSPHRFLTLRNKDSATLDSLVIQKCGTKDVDDGVISVVDSELIARKVRLQNGVSNPTRGAGAITVRGASRLSLHSSTVSDCTGRVGGVLISGAARFEINNTQFASCLGADLGGALSILEGAVGTITASTFFRGRAELGGALYVHSSGVTITGSSFVANQASNLGGAVWLDAVLESQFTRCDFSQNIAVFGGAVGISDYADPQNTTVVLANSSWTSNFGIRGGGLFVQRGVRPLLRDVVMTLNHADEQGGAVYLRENASIALSRAVLVANSAPSTGAALFLAQSTAHIADSLLLLNNCTDLSDTMGGLAFLDTDSRLHIEQSVITQNYAALGGAVYMVNGSSLVLSQSVAAFNNATVAGGAVHSALDSHVHISSSLVQGNVAADAGALHIAGNLTVTDTEFKGNKATASVLCKGMDGYGGAITLEGTAALYAHAHTPVAFLDNEAGTTAGAIFFSDRSTPLSTLASFCADCTFVGNRAAFGADKATPPARLLAITDPPSGLVWSVEPGSRLPATLVTVHDLFNTTLLGSAVDLTIEWRHREGLLALRGTDAKQIDDAGRARFDDMVATFRPPPGSDVILPITTTLSIAPRLQHADAHLAAIITVRLLPCHDGILVPLGPADPVLGQELVCAPSVELSRAQRTGLLVGLSFVVILCALFFCATLWGRSSKIIYSASFPMLLCMLIAIGLFASGGILLSLPQTDALCSLERWCLHLGYTTLFGCLFLKSWRLDRIFHIKSLAQMQLSTKRLLLLLALILLIDLLLLCAQDVLAPLRIKSAYRRVCATDPAHDAASILLSSLLLGGKTLLTGATLLLIIRLRRIPAQFNEFSTVLPVIVNAALTALPAAILNWAIQQDAIRESSLRLSNACLVLYGSLSTLLLFFGPKMRGLLLEGQQEVNVNRIRSATWFQLRDALLRGKAERVGGDSAAAGTGKAKGTGKGQGKAREVGWRHAQPLSERQVTLEQQAIRKILNEVDGIKRVLTTTEAQLKAEERFIYRTSLEIDYLRRHPQSDPSRLLEWR